LFAPILVPHIGTFFLWSFWTLVLGQAGWGSWSLPLLLFYDLGPFSSRTILFFPREFPFPLGFNIFGVSFFKHRPSSF